MPTINTDITKPSVTTETQAEVNTEAYNAAVWYLGNTPTYIDLTKVDARAVDFSPATLIQTEVVASEIVNLIVQNAYEATRARRAHAYLIGGTDHGVNITSLTDAYKIWFPAFDTLAATYSVSTGADVSASNLTSAMQAISNLLDWHRANSAVIDAGVCHSSCHSSCHSDGRTRR